MSERANNPSHRYGFGASIGLVCAALLCFQAAAAVSAQAADLYGTRTYDRQAYPAEDPRHADIYEIPRRDRYQEADVRRDDRRDGIRTDVYREDRSYDSRYDRDESYEHTTRPAVSGRYVARDHDPRFFRDDRQPDRYADRVPEDLPLSLKDSPPLKETFAEPSQYETDRYESYGRERHPRHEVREFKAERYHKPHVHHRDAYDRYERACMGRRDIKRALRSEGWRGFVDFDLGRDRARVNARRNFDGRRYILTLDSCTGDIIAALPIERRYNRW